MEEEQINNAMEKLYKEIEVLKEQTIKRGLAFSSPTREQLKKKLRSTHTPFISGQSWKSIGYPLDTFKYIIYVHNPDPNQYFNFYAYFFFGPANLIPDIGTALLSAENRLNRMFAEFPGFNPDSTEYVQFNYKFPSGTPPGLYLGNSFIFMMDQHDVGTYIDRGCIYVTVN